MYVADGCFTKFFVSFAIVKCQNPDTSLGTLLQACTIHDEEPKFIESNLAFYS